MTVKDYVMADRSARVPRMHHEHKDNIVFHICAGALSLSLSRPRSPSLPTLCVRHVNALRRFI